MENEILKDILNYISKNLTESYGYCGVVENENGAYINSDDRNGNYIKIKISIIPE